MSKRRNFPCFNCYFATVLPEIGVASYTLRLFLDPSYQETLGYSRNNYIFSVISRPARIGPETMKKRWEVKVAEIPEIWETSLIVYVSQKIKRDILPSILGFCISL